MELIGMEHVELISRLLNNRQKIVYTLRWRQAASEEEKEAVRRDILNDASVNGAALLRALQGGRAKGDAAGARRAEPAEGAPGEGGGAEAAGGGAAGTEHGGGGAEAAQDAEPGRSGVRGGRPPDEQEDVQAAGGHAQDSEAGLGGGARAGGGEPSTVTRRS